MRLTIPTPIRAFAHSPHSAPQHPYPHSSLGVMLVFSPIHSRQNHHNGNEQEDDHLHEQQFSNTFHYVAASSPTDTTHHHHFLSEGRVVQSARVRTRSRSAHSSHHTPLYGSRRRRHYAPSFLARALYAFRQWCIASYRSLPSRQQLTPRAAMRKLCPICGPKASVFCMVMSVWGVIFLGLLGIFFYMQAVTLFPDLVFTEAEEKQLNPNIIEQKYSEKAVQCWIAAGLYLVTLIVVFWQNKFNTTQIF